MKTINVVEYLKRHENKELLRFITCGSVDDGKSTLIGRLLHDTKQIYEDQLASVKRDSRKIGRTGDELDLSLLLDGLQAEREQGITIDVAYRYFSTDKKKFIIADTPGHEQYTRNMATGASTADLAIILIDAKKGLLPQTKRHSYIVNLMGIKYVIVAINKMDAVHYKQDIFDKICSDYLEFAKNLSLKEIFFVPVSALKGDNIVHKSENMKWYKNKPLIKILEKINISENNDLVSFRFPVQYVNRPNSTFRGYCGTVISGTIKKGDDVIILPSKKRSTIKSIVTYDGEIEKAYKDMAVTIKLADEIDISRGDVIASPEAPPDTGDSLDVMIVWMSEEEMRVGKNYEIKIGTSSRTAYFETIHYAVNINTLEHFDAKKLMLNEIAFCRLTLTDAIVFDSYEKIKSMGSFIVIDKLSNNTVACGMIKEKAEGLKSKGHFSYKKYSEFEFELNQLIVKYFPHWGSRDLSK